MWEAYVKIEARGADGRLRCSYSTAKLSKMESVEVGINICDQTAK